MFTCPFLQSLLSPFPFSIFKRPNIYSGSRWQYVILHFFCMLHLFVTFRMIVICLVFICQGKGTSAHDLTLFNINGLSTLYGATIYAFMCHHSLPSIVTPIKHKNRLSLLFAGDYTFIYAAYLLLCYAAMFAYGDQPLHKCSNKPGPPCQIQQLFTLNFTSFRML